MKIREVAQPNPPTLLGLLVFLAVLLLAGGCGAPGEPTPPSPPIPKPVTDLTARQLGDAVLLTFTLPTKSTLGERLKEVPTMEVWRGGVLPDGSTDPHSFRLVDTIPGSLLGTYADDGKVSFPDPLQPEELRARMGEIAIFRIRTRVSERKASPDSNEVSLDLYPVPQRIETLEAQVTEKSIRLSWTAPNATSAGAQLPPIEEYHVYRGELDPTSAEAANTNLHDAVWKLPLLQIGVAVNAEYRDSTFDFGRTYVYVVRSSINEGGHPIESGDSRPAIVTPKDIYPPATPLELVAAVLPGTKTGSYVVDLSWGINLETDLAGYHVYRSESAVGQRQLLTPDLLPTPTFRDTSVLSEHKYWYRVTAVDRAGNESAPSAATLVDLP